MPKLYHEYDANGDIQRYILRLRYGTESPSKQSEALVSYTCISRYLKVPYNHVLRLTRKYFRA